MSGCTTTMSGRKCDKYCFSHPTNVSAFGSVGFILFHVFSRRLKTSVVHSQCCVSFRSGFNSTMSAMSKSDEWQRTLHFFAKLLHNSEHFWHGQPALLVVFVFLFVFRVCLNSWVNKCVLIWLWANLSGKMWGILLGHSAWDLSKAPKKWNVSWCFQF